MFIWHVLSEIFFDSSFFKCHSFHPYPKDTLLFLPYFSLWHLSDLHDPSYVLKMGYLATSIELSRYEGHEVRGVESLNWDSQNGKRRCVHHYLVHAKCVASTKYIGINKV